MKLKEIVDKSFDLLKDFDIRPILPALRACNEGAIDDVLNINGCANYQWWPNFIEVVKPKQIIELGGAMGVGSLMMLNSRYTNFKLYSITLEEGGLEFSYVVDIYPNFIPVIGDDLTLENWPKDLDLAKTDIWYFDSEHSEKQLKTELKLYTPYFHKGAFLVFDDIRMPQLWSIWEKLSYEKLELTDPLHFTGYGVAQA